MIAIGLKYGNDEPGNIEQDALCQQKVKEFQQKFTDRRKSLICRDLLGYDLSLIHILMIGKIQVSRKESSGSAC